ncbi:putative retrovirus-related pol polyprotein from transposon opus [Trichonephila clavipes]|nr:putative retrovirus-related pol polyprotein from transposon opus [Trichonephila clavipes]
MPSFIHSDRGSSFMSHELKSFLTSQGIATSRTTPYNPAGNGQVERYNGIIWKTIQLALRSNSMKMNNGKELSKQLCIPFAPCCVQRQMPLLMNECFLILEDPITAVPYLLGLQSLVQFL